MKHFKMKQTSNFSLGDLISRLRVAKITYCKFIIIPSTNLMLEILNILYLNGIINHYTIKDKNIIIFFKYNQTNLHYYNIDLISTPGHPVYWTLDKLSLSYNNHNFGGFYIISTKYGLKTSTECLFFEHIGGKILLKISV